MGLTWRSGQGCDPSGVSRDESVSFPFPASAGCPYPVVRGLFLHLQSQQVSCSMFKTLSGLTLLCLPHKDPCGCIGRTQRIQMTSPSREPSQNDVSNGTVYHAGEHTGSGVFVGMSLGDHYPATYVFPLPPFPGTQSSVRLLPRPPRCHVLWPSFKLSVP